MSLLYGLAALMRQHLLYVQSFSSDGSEIVGGIPQKAIAHPARRGEACNPLPLINTETTATTGTAMTRRLALTLLLSFAAPSTFAGNIFRYADMNIREIAALDAARTVVLLPGGILEQHGPYLPAATDTHMSTHLARTLAAAITRKTDRDVLLLPLVYAGSDPANVIGDWHTFPGSLAVRPQTQRQVFMDYGDALGEAGFRNVFVVFIHGAPRHNLALDEAADYFNDTWGGTMVHLYGLLDVQEQWTVARTAMSKEAADAQGYSVHSSAAEHSAVLYLAPELVDMDYRNAVPWRADDAPGMVALAHRKDWPGYFGSPKYATHAIGEAAITAVEERAVAIALEILAGADAAKFARFSALPGLRTQESEHAKRQRERQEAWLARRAESAPQAKP